MIASTTGVSSACPPFPRRDGCPGPAFRLTPGRDRHRRSRGIGRQTVGRLAADGYTVAVGCAGNQDEAEAAVKEAVNGGARAIPLRADVADEHAVVALFEAAESESGGVEVVVHAAAAPHRPQPRRRRIVSAVADRVRADFFHRIGLDSLLTAGSSL